MRRSFITALLILLATALIARGSTPADDAEAALAAARQRIAELCSQVAKLTDSLQQRDSEIAELIQRVNATIESLHATIERQQCAAPLIRDAVNGVLTAAKADLAAASREAADAGEALQRAQQVAYRDAQNLVVTTSPPPRPRVPRSIAPARTSMFDRTT
jgi:ABC-type transporter Mla subunit MlaD